MIQRAAVTKIVASAITLAALFSGELPSAAQALRHASDIGNAARPLVAATAPPPKPPRKGGNRKTKVHLKSWGATVTGQKQAGRGLLSDKQRSKSKNSDTPSSASRPRNRVPAKKAALQKFRFGISLCGFHGANAPNLTRCLPALDEGLPTEPNQPVVTPGAAVRVRMPRPEDVQWGEVLAESKNVLFPKLHVKVQPAGRTLVNVDTIVYTDESQVYRQTVTVLGFPVDVEAMPMSYTWSFGDGASVTTTTPGRPYPAKDITHKYMKKGGVSLTLTTNYAARFNVAGTGWQFVEGTVPITGPVTALQVREAVPVLVGPGR
jgi:hypothetical protein